MDGDTIWTDSKGNKVITFTGSGIGISSEGVSFPGNVGAYGTINATDTTSLFKTAAYNGTVEIVVKSAAAESDYMFAYQAPEYNSNLKAYQALLFCYNASTKKSTYVVENPKSAVRKLPSDFAFDQINTFSVAYLAGKAINGGYVSGFPGDTESGTFSGSGVSGSEAIIGGRCTHANRALKGTIYAIRIYNRRLSPAEIVENARLDKLRFIDKAEKPTFEDTPTEWGYTRQVRTAEGWELVEVYRATGKTYPWTVPDGVAKIDLLVVAGGGSGGSSSSGYPGTIAGGGGAGGIVYEQGIKVTPGSIYGIEVGLGGERTLGANGKTGGDSKFGDYYVAKGGGWGKFGGGSSSSSNGGEGGSGGGGSYGTANSTATQPNQPCGGYGHAGVKALSGAGGGGGGAGSAAGLIGAATYSPSGAFGAGMTIDITGEPEVYAVGGQGGLKATKQAGFSGRDGYGDGGSASIAYDTTGGNIESGKGGDGVVIVRYTPTYQVIFSDPENATILVKVDDQPISSKDTVLNGTDIVVEVTPDEFYEYAEAPEGWEKVEDSTAITRTFKVDYKNLEIEAPTPTEKPTFTVTALVCENGSITGAGTYYRDEVATLTATPDEGYAFKSWTGAAEGKEGALIELTITADIEVGATFEKMAADKRLVTYTGGENTSYTVKSGGEDVLPGSTVDVGATVVAVVKPNEHYAFIKPIPEGWVAGEGPGSLTKTFTAYEDVTFEIPSAELITFVLEIAQPEHGVISGTEPGALTEGDPVELSVEFDGGVYQFVN